MSNLKHVLSQFGTGPFLESLVGLSPEAQLAFLNVSLQMTKMTKEMEDPFRHRTSEKMAFADRLDDAAKQLEKVVGVGKVITKPTDIDQLLIERCANKDYQDPFIYPSKM